MGLKSEIVCASSCGPGLLISVFSFLLNGSSCQNLAMVIVLRTESSFIYVYSVGLINELFLHMSEIDGSKFTQNASYCSIYLHPTV